MQNKLNDLIGVALVFGAIYMVWLFMSWAIPAILPLIKWVCICGGVYFGIRVLNAPQFLDEVPQFRRLPRKTRKLP